MDLQPVQMCRTLDGWSPVHVPSQSDPELNHLVLVNPYVPKNEFVCDCKGFEYRGSCRHQGFALNYICWWPLGAHKEEQSDDERRSKRCPYCKGPTKWEMVDADAEEA